MLTLTAPRDFALVGGRLILSGTVSDAHGSVQVCACIGVCSGVRGKPVKLLKDKYPSEDSCEHAIFLKRVADLMAQYGVS